MNLYQRDVEWFKANHPNFTEAIRKALRKHVNQKIIEEVASDRD